MGILHSNPLGVMCQSFYRCIAACLAIADPGLVDGAAIFFTLAMRPPRENPNSKPGTVTQGIGTRGQGIQGVPREGRGCGSSETAASNLHACSSTTTSLASRRLQRGQVRQGAASICPPAYSLSRAPLGTGKHPLCMDALLRRFVQRLAGGMIGHMIPDAHGKTYKTDFIEAG